GRDVRGRCAPDRGARPVARGAAVLPQRPLQFRGEGDPRDLLLRGPARGLSPAVRPRREDRRGQGGADRAPRVLPGPPDRDRSGAAAVDGAGARRGPRADERARTLMDWIRTTGEA